MKKNIPALKGAHKSKIALVVPVLAALWLLPINVVSAQTYTTMKEIGTYTEKFAADAVGSAGFAAHIGLSWSDMYIGNLINIPPHWGMGLTVGATTMSLSSHIQQLSEAILGTELDDGFAASQLLPGYVVEARIGGFRGTPFDIGVKWGWLPPVPLFPKSVSEELTIYGLDFRYAVSRGWGRMPVVSIGFEVDQVNGGLSRQSPTTPVYVEKDDGTTTGGSPYITPGEGAVTSLIYQAWVFAGKVGVSKSFPTSGISIFADGRIGASIGTAGYKITGPNIEVTPDAPPGVAGAATGTPITFIADMLDSEMSSTASYLAKKQGKGKFIVLADSITSQFDSISFDLNLNAGLSFDFMNNTNLQFAIMFDFVHLEYGATISYRFQQ